jgi:hypothetical protein
MIAVSVIVALLLAILPSFGKGGRPPTRVHDATQIRGIHQGMVLFASDNQDRYPIPSELDKAHATLTSDSAKDDLGSVLSILIYAGFFPPELCVSPAEQSGLIRIDENYRLSDVPSATPNANGSASQAMWDPAFRGSSAEQVESNGKKAVGTLAERENVTSNNSYAMMPFFGARKEKWTKTFQATEAVLGNRGPSYEAVGSGANVKYRLLKSGSVDGNRGFTNEVGKGTSSVSLLIHGKRDAWEGNVAFNDNHVDFLERPDPEDIPFTFNGLEPASARKRADNMFVAENDSTVTPLPMQIGKAQVADNAATNPLMTLNNWLRTWTVSGVDQNAKTSEIEIVVD